MDHARRADRLRYLLGHDKAAAALGASIDELESKGWCHLSLGSVRSSHRKLTKPQIESIFDIHMMGEPTDAHYEACMASTIEAVLPLLDTL